MKSKMFFILINFLLFSRCSVNSSKNSPCLDDSKKYCSHVTPGAGRMRDCFIENKKLFSISCQHFIEEGNAIFDNQFKMAMGACNNEQEKYCGHLKKYAARRINCVKRIYLEDITKLSASCQEQFAKIVNIVPAVYP